MDLNLETKNFVFNEILKSVAILLQIMPKLPSLFVKSPMGKLGGNSIASKYRTSLIIMGVKNNGLGSTT